MGEIDLTRGGEPADRGVVAAVSRAQLRVIAERPRHRAVLSILQTEDDLPLVDLATQVVARRHEVPVSAVSADRRRGVTIDLHHYHLPRLAEVGLIERTDGRVSLGPAVPDRKPLEALDPHPVADERWEAIAALLADTRREQIVAVLAEADETLSIGELAERLAIRESGCGTPTERAIESVRVSLHHVHLPKLVDLDVIEYDQDARTVEVDGLPTAYRAVAAATDATVTA